MTLRVGLFCDREDWILGTIARQIMRCLGTGADFEFYLSSQTRIYSQPITELRALAACDLIHWISPYGYQHFAKLFADKPQVCSLHHIVEGDAVIFPANFPNARILTANVGTREMLQRRGFSNVAVVHYGVPDVFLQTPLSQAEGRRQLNLSDESAALIGFFGKGSSNPGDRKGTRVLIEALRLVNQHRRVGLLLSGEGWDSLLQMLQSLHIPAYFRPVKDLAEMRYHYAAIDLYVCTSRVEGGPVPVLEAMACQRPVISTPVGHVPELIEQGQNGLLVPIDDAAAVASAIDQLLTDLTDPVTRTRLADAGRATVLKEWTWDISLQPLKDIYLDWQRQEVRVSASAVGKISQLVALLARWARYKVRRTFS